MITEKLEKVGRTLQSEAERAKDAYDTLRDEASEVADRASELGKQVNNSAQNIWKKVMKEGTHLTSQVTSSSEKSIRSLAKVVEKYPVRAAASALALGIVIGAFITSSRD